MHLQQFHQRMVPAHDHHGMKIAKAGLEATITAKILLKKEIEPEKRYYPIIHLHCQPSEHNTQCNAVHTTHNSSAKFCENKFVFETQQKKRKVQRNIF